MSNFQTFPDSVQVGKIGSLNKAGVLVRYGHEFSPAKETMLIILCNSRNGFRASKLISLVQFDGKAAAHKVGVGEAFVQPQKIVKLRK